MFLLSKKVETFRNAVKGFTYLFEDDSELTLDLDGQIVDYSGMGSKKAERIAKDLK